MGSAISSTSSLNKMAESVDIDVESIDASPNALIDAVKGGLISSINDVQRVIGQDRAVDINKADEAFGFTALHWAVVNSSTMHSIVIEALIEAGADIEARCNKLKTPLIWAAEMGQIFACEYLLERGADTEARDKTGKNFILSMANGCRQWPVQLTKGDRVIFDLKTFLSKVKVDVNAKTNIGYTPLHLAARKGIVPFIDAILDLGGDMEIPNKDGKTPLWVAADNNQVEAVRHLLVKGANPNATDNKGQSVMSLAVHNNSHLVIRELVLHGIPLDAPMLMHPQQIKALNTLRTIKDKTEAIKPSSLRTTCAKCKANIRNLMVCLPCRHISLCKGCCKEEDDMTCNVCQAKVFCRADLSTTLDSKTDCMVCTELRYKPSVLLPCRHTGLCLACANNIKNIGGQCPKCRERVEGVGSKLSPTDREKIMEIVRTQPSHHWMDLMNLMALGDLGDLHPIHHIGMHGGAANQAQLDNNNVIIWSPRVIRLYIGIIEAFMAKNVIVE